MLKKLYLILFSGLFVFVATNNSFANDEFYDFSTEDAVIVEDVDESENEIADQMSANALLNYDANGSLFEKIVTLEQEKVVAQLEKERAQLDLDMERLNAEKIKLQMELDTLSGRAEQQQHELAAAKTQLDIQTEKLRRQITALDSSDEENEEPVSYASKKPAAKKEEGSVSKKYKLINVAGMGNQLQATIEEISTGQNKRISVGKQLDGYTVKSISLNEGIVFEKDGETESLNIGK